MTEPRLNHVQCLDTKGLHRMAYWEWGDAANPQVLVCAHGFGRQGRDFDTLAQAMVDRYRVICPDVVGRGQSDRLADPMAYVPPTYVADMVTLLARLNASTVHWVGTSMGGVIGLGLAALNDTPIRKLVLNDVGPRVEWAFVQRLRSYLGAPLRWATLEEAADYLWSISSSFGPHSREQWLALSKPQLRRDGDAYVLHYDPAIGAPVAALTPDAAAVGEAMMWAAYDRVPCPTLLLRGVQSDLLSHETAQAMTQRGPKATLVEFAGVGHAPTLVQPDQVAVVRNFLLSP